MILNKYTEKDNERIRIIADAILIFSFIGRLENQSTEITGFKASIEKYSHSLIYLVDNFSDGLFDQKDASDLSDDLMDIFFLHNNEYDIKNFIAKESEILLAENIYLKMKEALEIATKKTIPF